MIGIGVLKGLGVVLKEFLGTYPAGRWLLGKGVKTADLSSFGARRCNHCRNHRLPCHTRCPVSPRHLRRRLGGARA